MWDYLKSLPTTTQGFVLGLLISFITTALISFLKDLILPIYFENRKSRKQKIDVFKNYKNPLTESAINLCFRLREISHGRGRFLLSESPKNSFNTYQYLSTMYRLCSLIGWIRASKLEWSYYEIGYKKEKFLEIEGVLFDFEKCLSSGQDIELLRLQQLAVLWEICIDHVPDKEKKVLGIKIDDLLQLYEFNHGVNIATELNPNAQLELVLQISLLVTEGAKTSQVSEQLLQSTLEGAISELSRVEAYIYKDWFNAIGDLMIYQIDNSTRNFAVIGFKTFEDICLFGSIEQKRWLSRVDKFFWNLNTEKEDRFDARIAQFKRLFRATVDIIDTFENIGAGQTIVPKDFSKLRDEAYRIFPLPKKAIKWYLPSWWTS